MYKGLLMGRVMFLKDCVYQRLRRTCIYGGQELINNLRQSPIEKISLKTPQNYNL